MATLAPEIRAQIDQGKTNKTIAKELGCTPEYVRATRSRYLRPELSRAWQEAYRKTPECRRYQNAYRRLRYSTDPEYRDRQRGYQRRWYEKKKATA